MNIRFLMGSSYFFSCYTDFYSHDRDYVELVDTSEFKHKRTIRGQGKDIIQLKLQSKSEILNYDLNSSLSMVVGKYLIPEFCEAIGFTINDLPKVKPLIDALDSKHIYERIIYEAYLSNGSFTLTDAQRLEAYKTYKKARSFKL